MSVLSFLQDRRLVWPAYILVMCLLSALFFGSLKDHLLDVHDHETFQDNIAIGEDFSFFFSPEKQQPTGRPAADLVKYVAYEIGGNDPGFFHLLVVAVHTVAALLLASLCWRLGMGPRLSLAGGLLFLVNVAHFQAVHHISALDYPLALALGLGALHCYVTWMSTRRWGWLLAFYLASVISIAALAVMVFLWPFCLYLSWSRGEELKTAVRPLLPLLVLMAAALVLIVAITPGETNAGRAIGHYLERGAADNLRSMGEVLLWFSSRLLTTAHWLLVPLYELQPWELYAGAGVLTGLAVFVYGKGSPGSIWSVWVLLSLLPFVPLADAEAILNRASGPSRYLYLATAGTSLLLAWGLEEGSRRLLSWGRYLHGVLLASILLSSYHYLKEAEAASLYASGRNYITRGDVDTGVEQLKRAIDQGRDAIDLEDAYERFFYMGMGKEGHEAVLDEALAAFPNSLALNTLKLAHDSMKPDSLLSSRARKQLEVLKGQDAEASIEVAWGKRIVLNNKETIQATRRWLAGFFHNTGHNLGTGSATLEDLEKAILAYRRALEFDPDRTATYENLVNALASAGRETEAVLAAREAVERNPEATGGLLISASLGLLASGRAEEAIVHCHRALRVRHRSAIRGSLRDLCRHSEGRLRRGQHLGLHPHGHGSAGRRTRRRGGSSLPPGGAPGRDQQPGPLRSGLGAPCAGAGGGSGKAPCRGGGAVRPGRGERIGCGGGPSKPHRPGHRGGGGPGDTRHELAGTVSMGEPLSTGPAFWRIVSDRRLLWPGYVVVMCVVSALFFGSLKDHGLDMDDDEAFRDNIRMAEDFSFFFSSEKHQPGGRPLAELVKLAGYLIWGNDPGFFHLQVVAFHTLAAILLTILFVRQGVSLRVSLVGGVFFLVNVAHFRAVHWIQAIEFPLALSCGLGALLCYQHFLEHRSSRWLWGFYGGFVLSIAALSAMAFLWTFCLYWSWVRERDIRASLRPLLPLLPVVALELVVIVALTHKEYQTWLAIDQLTAGEPFRPILLGMGRLFFWLLSRLLTTAHWLPFPLYELGPWESYAGAGVLAGLGVLVLVYWRRFPLSLWFVWIPLSLFAVD